MKVILTKDVARLGRKSDIKEVPDGHAINFLIPRKMAIIATPDSIRKHDEEMKQLAASNNAAQRSFDSALAALSQAPVTLAVNANDKGHLYKSITVEDIAARLTALGHSVTKTRIILSHPIKEVGMYEIALSHSGVTGSFTLSIIAQ